jgi:hypothetical protein
MFSIINRLRAVLKKNLHPERYARHLGVTLGKGCRLIKVDFSTEPYLVRFGSNGSTLARFKIPNCVAAGVPARVIKSIAEYRDKVVPEGSPTKSLSDADKRAYYLKQFGGR